LGEAVEKIDDPAELAQVRKQARKVNIESVVAGLVMTLIALAIP
jgi:hypothetical protein